MAELHRITRRLFLRDAGRGTVALAVLGTGTLAACSSDGDISADASIAGGQATAVPAAAVDPTVAPTPEPRAEPTAVASPTEVQPAAVDESAADGEMLPLRWERVELGFVSAYVLARGNEVAIVDTGLAGSTTAIGGALDTVGAGWGDVDHVILTHLHGDHVGGLPQILGEAPDAVAYAGAADVDGIESPRPITPLNDGDEIFGMEIIATPGHTAGHISILDPDAGFLVAGDAMVEDGGMILGPLDRFTDNMSEANASVRRLAERRFETVVFGHGNPVESGASDAVIALAQTL